MNKPVWITHQLLLQSLTKALTFTTKPQLHYLFSFHFNTFGVLDQVSRHTHTRRNIPNILPAISKLTDLFSSEKQQYFTQLPNVLCRAGSQVLLNNNHPGWTDQTLQGTLASPITNSEKNK